MGGGGGGGEVEKDGKRPQQKELISGSGEQQQLYQEPPLGEEIPSPAEEGLFDTYLIVVLSTALLYLAAWRTRRRRERMLGVAPPGGL